MDIIEGADNVVVRVVRLLVVVVVVVVVVDVDSDDDVVR